MLIHVNALGIEECFPCQILSPFQIRKDVVLTPVVSPLLRWSEVSH